MRLPRAHARGYKSRESCYYAPVESSEIRRRSCPECVLCGATGVVRYTGLRDTLFGAPGEWNVTQCPNPDCGLLWLDPMPIEDDLGLAYQGYYTHDGELVSGSTRDWRHWLAHQAFRGCLRVVGLDRERERSRRLYLDRLRPGTVLEVGCGAGQRLARLRDCGWQVQGQEIDPEAARVARETFGLEVHVGLLAAAELGAARFDAVAMNHVIEHVPEPVQLLTECRRLLKPGGTLVVVTPNTDSFLHARFGRCWRGLEPPRHLHLFSPRTLGKIARRAGFPGPKCWTTAANAFGVAVGSLRIQTGTGSERVGLRLAGLRLQWQARRAHVRQPETGEECVLQATKP